MNIRYILKKFGVALLTIAAASLLTFTLLRLMPGDIVEMTARDWARQYGLSLTEAKGKVKQMLSYDPDEPIPKQMADYYRELIVEGNLGTSMWSKTLRVNDVIAQTLPWTLFVLSISLGISFFLGTHMGMVMAWKRKSILNPLLSTYAIVFQAIPNYIFAVFLIMIFGVSLKLLPMTGAYDPSTTPGFNLPFILSMLKHAILPVLTYVLTTMGGWALSMKGASMNVLGEDYVNAAYARGLPDKLIVNRYVKKNAMLPMVTGIAMSFGAMISGSTLIENTFLYPGVGYFIAKASSSRDFTMMQGLLLITSIANILANLVADLIYSKLDPRIKAGE